MEPKVHPRCRKRIWLPCTLKMLLLSHQLPKNIWKYQTSPWESHTSDLRPLLSFIIATLYRGLLVQPRTGSNIIAEGSSSVSLVVYIPLFSLPQLNHPVLIHQIQTFIHCIRTPLRFLNPLGIHQRLWRALSQGLQTYKLCQVRHISVESLKTLFYPASLSYYEEVLYFSTSVAGMCEIHLLREFSSAHEGFGIRLFLLRIWISIFDPFVSLQISQSCLHGFQSLLHSCHFYLW